MSAVDPARDRVVELRQYTLHPGRRDELMTLFAHAFVDAQGAVGARVRGVFIGADDPDRFVWLRAFDSMPARCAALTAFYDGPVWRAHRDAANATMRDSDNVLLLRPFAADGEGDRRVDPTGACIAIVHDLRAVDPATFVNRFETVAGPMLRASGAVATTSFVTETSPNTFDRLPVRSGESVFVCMAFFTDLDAVDRCVAAMKRGNPLRDLASEDLLPAFMRRPELLRLLSRPAR